jgi:hypothetical protein
MEIHGLGFESLYGSILTTFFHMQFHKCGKEIFF